MPTLCMFTDRVLEQLHETSKKISSPQPVPTVLKSPSQDINSVGSNGSSSNRWKRNSPDPNKMMMGRSPMDANAKRILATTPRRASHQAERVGSPCLSGYPVRLPPSLHQKLFPIKLYLFFRVFDGALWTAVRRLAATDTFRMISMIFTNTKRIINTLRTWEHTRITATTNMPSLQRLNGTRCFGISICFHQWMNMVASYQETALTTRASSEA